MTLGRNERESQAFARVRPREHAGSSLRELLRRMWAEGYVIQAYLRSCYADVTTVCPDGHGDDCSTVEVYEKWDIVHAPWIAGEKGPRKKDRLVGTIRRNVHDDVWTFELWDAGEWGSSAGRVSFARYTCFAEELARYDKLVNLGIAMDWWQHA